MFLERVCLISAVVVAACAAPKRISRSTPTPMWHLPCGEDVSMEDDASWENFEEESRISLESLRLQHQLTMNDYLSRDYNYLYEKVHFGVAKDQYIPNWLPGEKDLGIVKKLTNANLQTIVNHFPKLHVDLQKFAVAFEQVIEDELDSKKKKALKGTQSHLKRMLCEVESNIATLPSLRIPQRVERSIMSDNERNLHDDSNRLVRDWGVVFKYQDYLHAWRHVFNY